MKDIKDILERMESQTKDLPALKQSMDELNRWKDETNERLKATDDWKAEFRKDTVSLPGCDEGKDRIESFIPKALYGMAHGHWRFPDGAKVKAILDETTEKYWATDQGRALSTVTGSTGGNAVPEQYIAQFIELARAKSVVMAMGATPLTNLQGSPVVIPKHTTAGTAYDVAENASITASDQAIGQVSMTPKMVGALTEMSRLVDVLTNPAIASLVEADLAEILALRMDIRILRGTGSSNAPLGIVNLSNVGSVAIGTNGGICEYDHLIQLEGQLEDNNLLKGRLGFVMNPAIRRRFARQVDSDGRPLFMRGMDRDPSSQTVGRTLIGYPYMTTTQLPTNLSKGTLSTASEVIFGNWEELLVGQWGNLVLEATTQAGNYFGNHQMAIKAVSVYDCMARHDESFAVIADADAS